MLLLCWIAFPVLLLGLCLGHGALIRALSGRSLEAALLVPAGLAGGITTATALTFFDLTSGLAAPALVAAAAAGLVLERRLLLGALLNPRQWWLPCAAALGVFGVFGAPVFLAGAPTFTGYTAIVDIAHQLDFAAWLTEHGRSAPALTDSSWESVIEGFLGSGYPSGTQALLGSSGLLTGIELTWLYQPFVAFVGAVTALSVFVLLRPAIERTAPRALAACIAGQPNVLVGYGLAGGIKEVAAAGMLVLFAALLQSWLRGDGHGPRALLAPGVAAAAGVAALSLLVLPWLAVMAAGAAVLGRRRRHRRVPSARRALAFATVVLLLAWPAALAATKVAPSIAVGLTEAELGNLAAPISPWSAAGVWLTGDHRFPLDARQLETVVGVALALGLAVGGVAVAMRWRRPWLALVGLAGVLGLGAVALPAGPWVDLKAFAISGPIVLSLAFAGAAGVAHRRLRPVGWAAAAVLAGLVFWGNALAYHGASLAPYDRLRDLERIGRDFSGLGPTLYPAYEEHAEFLLRRERGISTTNPPGGEYGVTTQASGSRSGQETVAFDLDEYEPAFLQRFALIVMRTSPLRSRPPSNYRLERRTRFHEVWRRLARPRIIRRLPLSGNADRGDGRVCAAIVRSAGRQPDHRLAYARTPELISFNPATATVSPNWARNPEGGVVLPRGPGRIVGRVGVPTAGRYAVWVTGSFGREVGLSVDGQRVGALENQLGYPGQIMRVGTRALSTGAHELLIERGGGSLKPGNGDGGTPRPIGLVYLEREVPQSGAVRILGRARSGEALCRRPERLDWLEVLSTGA